MTVNPFVFYTTRRTYVDHAERLDELYDPKTDNQLTGITTVKARAKNSRVISLKE